MLIPKRCLNDGSESRVCTTACEKVNSCFEGTSNPFRLDCTSYLDRNNKSQFFDGNVDSCTWQREDLTETIECDYPWECLKDLIVENKWQTAVIAAAFVLFVIILIVVLICICRACRCCCYKDREAKSPKQQGEVFKSVQEMALAGLDIELAGMTGQETYPSSEEDSSESRRKQSISSSGVGDAPSLSGSYSNSGGIEFGSLPTGAPVEQLESGSNQESPSIGSEGVYPDSLSASDHSASERSPSEHSDTASSPQSEPPEEDPASASEEASISDPGAPSEEGSNAIGSLDDLLDGI